MAHSEGCIFAKTYPILERNTAQTIHDLQINFP